MIRNRRIRRGGALALFALGALLLWLAPASPLGLLAFAVGVVLELAGLAIEHRDDSR